MITQSIAERLKETEKGLRANALTLASCIKSQDRYQTTGALKSLLDELRTLGKLTTEVETLELSVYNINEVVSFLEAD